MPLGGKKKKKGKKAPTVSKRKLRFRTAQEDYAQVKTLFGDRRIQIRTSKGLRKAHIPGKFRKRVWINKEDWVLVQPRSCDTGKEEDQVWDVLHVYKRDEVRMLERLGEIILEKDSEGEEDLFCDDEFAELEEKEDLPRKRYEIEYPSSFTPSETTSEVEEEV